MDRRTEHAVLALIAAPDQGPLAAWTALTDEASADGVLRDQHGEMIAEVLRQYIPSAPLLDRLTPAIEGFAARWPAAALKLLVSLLTLEHDRCDTSGLRSWVLHILQLTGLAESCENKAMLAAACVTAKLCEPDRGVAVRIHALHMRLAPGGSAVPSDSDLVQFLNAVPVDRNISAALADTLIARWPESQILLRDSHASTLFKLKAVQHPVVFGTLLHHLTARKYVAGPCAERLLAFSAPVYALLCSALPLLPRLEAAAVEWAALATATDRPDNVRLSGVLDHVALDSDALTLLGPASSNRWISAADEITVALRVCPEETGLIVGSLYLLLAQRGQVPPDAAAAALKALLLQLPPRGFDDGENLRRVCMVTTVLVAIAPRMALPAGVRSSAVKFTAKARDAATPPEAWVLSALLRALQCSRV
ncbi:hypothetical protein ACHHYP_05205 [Achlya hypogyna]|uniref:Uncharacterized protein n=1 Tax=Achlya hypogyna TaxID=1202772 RepID=A0A1V9YYN7_ACHHY|nr:hypothetical protein ACHHYP_05205 [Achlya hypogyna]